MLGLSLLLFILLCVGYVVEGQPPASHTIQTLDLDFRARKSKGYFRVLRGGERLVKTPPAATRPKSGRAARPFIVDFAVRR